MGRRDIFQPVVLLLLAGIACGSAQLDTSDDFGMSSFGLRRLSAYYSRNFVSHFPVTCYQSSYFSPFRLYFKSYTFNDDRTTFIFQLDVSTCPFPKADCCRLWLDHLVVRTSSSAKVLGVRLDGQDQDYDVGAQGLTIYRMRVEPTVMRSMQLEITTPLQGYNYPRDLCPNGRHPGSCDIISYDESKTCCAERSALPYELFFPNGAFPPGYVAPDVTAPPGARRPPPRPPSPPPPPPPSPLPPSPPPPSPPSPLPPSPPPPSPPPPPPDGWSFCCIDDLPKSPYNLKYQGLKRSGSDTAYLFQLVATKKVVTDPDIDGPEQGDCANMNLRDLGVAIYDDLLVKSVQFNGTIQEHWDEPQGSKPDAKWIYINVFKTIDDFDEDTPIDLVITVRGKVDSLCPANNFLHSSNACEFTMHGKGLDQHCCPHGATKRGGPPDDCCVDDIDKAPYRMQYINTNLTNAKSEYEFVIKVVNVTGIDFDMEEPAQCDHMTLDYAQIQIYKKVDVLQVKWEDRVMGFNITPATDYSNWLNINGINRFVNDFDPNLPVKVTVVVSGYVRELCSAGLILDTGGAIICEYVLHGVQGNHTCCPHDTTKQGNKPPDCGCRDDLAGTPYRLGYQLSGVGNNQIMFNFDLAKIDPSAAADFDGAPDQQFGVDADCSRMAVKHITFIVHKDLEIQDVIFNGFNYTWQFEPYTDSAKWLKVLDLDYRPSDFPADALVPLQVLTKDSTVTELCPASSQFSSQASCEYVLYGLSDDFECCPSGVTTWTSQFRTSVR